MPTQRADTVVSSCSLNTATPPSGDPPSFLGIGFLVEEAEQGSCHDRPPGARARLRLPLLVRRRERENAESLSPAGRAARWAPAPGPPVHRERRRRPVRVLPAPAPGGAPFRLGPHRQPRPGRELGARAGLRQGPAAPRFRRPEGGGRRDPPPPPGEPAAPGGPRQVAPRSRLPRRRP